MNTLKHAFLSVCKKHNLAYSKDNAIHLGHTKYLAVDFASCYGGYRLVNVSVNGGGHSGAFNKSGCEARVSKKQFLMYLGALVMNEHIELEYFTYHREPTAGEIKFGEGATHYKDFSIDMCTDDNFEPKKWIKCPIDRLRYYRD